MSFNLRFDKLEPHFCVEKYVHLKDRVKEELQNYSFGNM